ncbi:MAG: hypothetical protein DMF11_14245 [Verrucomicrobia bacterium]|nr:MAG: hypothetical protein DMF11_14245 [Verrucomicrobiota bacterium]
MPIIPGTWQTNAITFLLLVMATLVLYVGDLRLGFFAVDDPQYVVENPWIRGVTFENLRHILATPYFANYSPLHLLSYTIDYVFAGLNPFGFHLSSNLWGGLVAGFVFLLALALTGSRLVAVAAAVLFILHPAHVEAIAWISSRKDLVAAAHRWCYSSSLWPVSFLSRLSRECSWLTISLLRGVRYRDRCGTRFHSCSAPGSLHWSLHRPNPPWETGRMHMFYRQGYCKIFGY